MVWVETGMTEPMAKDMAEERSDAEVMARARRGDREAFAELVDRHKDAVVSYLTRLCGDRDRAEDLGQETFLRLFLATAYAEQGYLRAYLFRIATNLVRSEERRDRRLRLLLPFLGRAADRIDPAAHQGLLRAELHGAVAAALAELPLRFRVPLVLHEIEGWPYAAIAEELQCREGTVKSRVHRGRLHLKRKLEPYWHGGTSWKTASPDASEG
jgi:RNA polymerase sigma-70 factor (ECF subfamily)